MCPSCWSEAKETLFRVCVGWRLEGLGDFERYSERKKTQKQVKKKRAVSNYNYVARTRLNASDHTAQDLYEILSQQSLNQQNASFLRNAGQLHNG